MILYFEVGGVLNFEENQIIFFTPTVGARLINTRYENRFNTIGKNKQRILKSTVVYGNNGSGKTNLIKAISLMKEIIVNGIPHDINNYINNKSDKMNFLIAVVDNLNDEYEYEIVIDKNKNIIKEALNKNDKKIFEFEREKEDHLIDSKINQKTLLSIKSENVDNESINFINYFKTYINIMNVEEKKNFSKEDVSILTEKRNFELMVDLLSYADHTISGVNISTKDNRFIMDIVRGELAYNIEDESRSIKQIYYMLPEFIKLINQKNGYALIIDDLDLNLNTVFLIKFFNLAIHNQGNFGQLIATMKDLCLFDLDYFSKMQLYIITKTHKNGSLLSSVDDYDLRSEKKNIAQLYLNGSFGG